MFGAWKHMGVAAALPLLALCGCVDPHGAPRDGGAGDDGGDKIGAGDGGGAIGDGGGVIGEAGGSLRGISATWADNKNSVQASSSIPGPSPDNDTCTGEAVALGQGTTVSIEGTLVDAADDMTTFCADASDDPGNPDVVYQLDVAEDISLSIQLTASGFDPALSIRLTTCTSEVGGDACLDLDPTTERTRLSLAEGTYWIVVDSADGNAGQFTLDLTATAPVCGDGVLNAGEQCDPGAGADDDGCFDPGTADECTFGESPLDATVTGCPGVGPVSVPVSGDPMNPTILRTGKHNNGSGGHAQQNDLTADPDVCGWPAVGPENVFHVVPQADGTLHARIGYDDAGNVVCSASGCGDFILYVRQGSCEPADPADPGQQTACADWDPQEILDVEMPVTAGSDYWVFVDGLDDTYGIGDYYLELWLL